MAKLQPAEERIRKDLESFVDNLNRVPSIALSTHWMERFQGRRDLPVIDPENDPKWREKLVEPARKHFKVWEAIVAAIKAEEAEDEKALEEAVEPLRRMIDGTAVTLHTEWQEGQLRLIRRIDPDQEGIEEKPFPAFVLADRYLEYLERHRELAHLGVCRQCGEAYLKPKHGRKTRYCSPACRQKAFRRRRAESEQKNG